MVMAAYVLSLLLATMLKASPRCAGIHADLARQHHDQHAGTEALLKKLARSYKTVQAEDKGAALAREKDALKARLGKHAVAPSFGAQGGEFKEV